MQYYFGQSNMLRILDEAQFWKHQESEHPQVIIAVTPGLEDNFKAELKQWSLKFTETEASVVKLIEEVIRSNNIMNPILKQQIINMISFSTKQSMEFINFLNKLESQSKAVQNNQASQEVINHIRRESEYYIGIADAFLKRPM